MPQYTIKKISIWSCSRTCGLLFGIFALAGIVIFLFIMSASFILEGSHYYGPKVAQILIVGTISFFGLVVVGLASGALIALLFNLIAPRLGGLDVEIEIKE